MEGIFPEPDYSEQRIPPYRRFRVPKLPTQPEFLFTDFEETIAKEEKWLLEKIILCTGYAYLSGGIVGVTKGSYEGYKSAERGESLKLRANRILISGGQTGGRYANSMGLWGLVFGGIERGIVNLAETEASWTTVVAGIATGALYKRTSGPRNAAVAGAIGGLATGVFVSARQVIYKICS